MWHAVQGAQTYAVEHTFLDPGETCDLAAGESTLVSSLTEPTYTYEFVGPQTGCWRVWAVDESGVGARSHHGGASSTRSDRLSTPKPAPI